MIALATGGRDPARDRLDEIATRLRSNGIYVLEIRPGRWPDPSDVGSVWFGSTADRPSPNDLFDHAREAARSQVEWVHALLEDYKAATALMAQLPLRYDGPVPRLYKRPSTRDRLAPATQRDIFADLVVQMPIGVRMITQSGHPLIVEFPELWLDLL